MRKVKEMLCAVLKKFGWLRNLNSKQQWLLLSVTLLLVALMLSGCAISSPNSRAVVVQPLSSAIAEPADASTFYPRLSAWQERVRNFLETETQDLGR